MRKILFFLAFAICLSVSYAQTQDSTYLNIMQVADVSIYTPGLTSVPLKIYTFNSATSTATLVNEGTISNGLGFFDLFGPFYEGISCLNTNPLDSNIAKSGVYLVVDNVYLYWQWVSGAGDYPFTYENGTLTNTKSGESSNSKWNCNIGVSANFTGGSFMFDGQSHNFGETISVLGLTFPHTISVNSSQYNSGGNKMLWDTWADGSSSASTSISLSTAKSYSLSANYDPAVNVTFTGSKVSVKNSKNVTTVVNPNEQYEVALLKPLKLTAVPNPGISYLSLNWSTGATTDTINYTPTANSTISLTATKKAEVSYRQLVFKNPDGVSAPTVGELVTLKWNKFDDPDVIGYLIYRNVKNVQTYTLIGIIDDRNITTFVDNNTRYTNGYTNNLINYDVIARMSSPHQNSESALLAVFGLFTPGGGSPGNPEANRVADNNKSGLKISAAIPTAYALGNYPNPFNPTTVIKYDLPEAGQVSLKVYNLLSQEVASLVEGSQSAGTHQVSFNAHNLPTGIYIARLQAGNKVMSVKLQLIK